MRVAHIITALSAHGAQMMLYKLMSRMDRGRFDSIIVSLTTGGALRNRIEALSIPVYTIGIKSAVHTPTSIWRLARIIKEFRPDLIQGWMYHGNLIAQLAGAFTPNRVPVLWNVRGSSYVLSHEKLATAATIWLGARLSRLPARIINNSEVSASNHEEKLSYCAALTVQEHHD